MLAANALVTLNQTKQFLGINQHDHSRDDELKAAINAASDYVENWCRRAFHKGTYKEHHRMGRSVILRNAPIVELKSIPAPYHVTDRNAGILRRPCCPSRTEGYFEYVGGFDEVPDIIQQATLRLIKSWEDTSLADTGLTAFREGEISGTLDHSGVAGGLGGAGMPKAVLAMLAPYRRAIATT